METKIKSVAEFTEAIIEKILSTDDEENSQIFWFRGEGNINYETPLVPKSYRTLAKTFKNYKDDSFYSKILKKLRIILMLSLIEEHKDIFLQKELRTLIGIDIF